MAENSTSADLQRRQQQKEAEIEASGGGQKKLPYPKSIWFIVGNEFCERFSYYGMRAILSIYIKNKLHFSEDTSTVIYHTFAMFCYFTPIFGAMIADQLLGKFRTIFYISIIYVLGHLLKTLAAVPTLGVPPVEFSLIGLALIAIGTGGIKPCVSAFGGDQFKLPEQERQLQTFFSVFYFAINSGSLISTFLTPVLREDVKCFGDDTCYSLAFAIPAILMLLATIILVMGKNMYVMKPPEGNIMFKVFGSITYAARKKFTSKVNREHWMDHAVEKYGKNLVEDVKLLLRVLLIYVPLPCFWALFDQQGSRWTFQATRMNGDLGFTIMKPDQIQSFNPALILILIPIFDSLIYPFCAKFNFLVKPLQRITVGGLLTAGSFVVSGFLELELMKTYDKVPKVDEAHFHFMNAIACPVSVRVSTSDGLINQHEDIEAKLNSIMYDLRPGLYDVDVRFDNCPEVDSYSKRFQFEAHDEKVTGLVIRSTAEKEAQIVELKDFEKPKKVDNGDTRLRAVFDIGSTANQSLYLRPYGDPEHEIRLPTKSIDGGGLLVTDYHKIPPSNYEVYAGSYFLGDMAIAQGGVRTLYISGNPELGYEQSMNNYVLTTENSVHMLWIIPQYFIITTGEIMFSITGLEFSYSQAPESMKSVLQAAFLLTVAFGNLIVIVVAEAKAFDDQASEFFMFAFLMLLDMLLFAIIAYFYKYVDVAAREKEREEEENRNQEQLRMERRGIANEGYSEHTDF